MIREEDTEGNRVMSEKETHKLLHFDFPLQI